MTSISALSSTFGSSSAWMPPPPPRSGNTGSDPMAAVAEKLGLSSDALKTQLQNGSSLTDVATAQGVSQEELVSAIKAGLPADAATSLDADSLAQRIAGSKGMPPPPPGGPRGELSGMADQDKLTDLSKLLDMDAEEVTSRATSATDLVKLLQDKGVDLGQLRTVLNNGDLFDVAA